MKLLQLWAVSVFTLCRLAAANVNSEKIDFEKVRPLFEKLRSGEQLTAAERNLVEQARAARKKALDAGEKDPAAANSEVSRADQPETPDWAMIERLRVEVVPESWTGRIVNPESAIRSLCPRNDVSTVPI